MPSAKRLRTKEAPEAALSACSDVGGAGGGGGGALPSPSAAAAVPAASIASCSSAKKAPAARYSQFISAELDDFLATCDDPGLCDRLAGAAQRRASELRAATQAAASAACAAAEAAGRSYQGSDAKRCWDCSASFQCRETGQSEWGGKCSQCDNYTCKDDECSIECSTCGERACRECTASCGHDCCAGCASLCGQHLGGCEELFCEDCLGPPECCGGEGCNRRAAEGRYCEQCLDHRCK